ncbi:MAG: hypothetical protein ABIG45_04140 [Bacillota bacterium]
MKRILLIALCLLALLLAGCTAVNQTNSFVDQTLPEVTASPVATVAPETTPPPVVQLNVQPTPAPGLPVTPAPDTPSPAPEESPGEFGGFNG